MMYETVLQEGVYLLYYFTKLACTYMTASLSSRFNRTQLLQQLETTAVWDVLVIGGGATGLGIAVDAASRGFSTLLLEKADFAKGTSSRSTKLVHGGVRYLAQGNIPLVYSALKERGRLLQNAPHVVHKRAFIIPCYHWADRIKYLCGLKLYDALAGKWSFGRSRWLSKAAVLNEMPDLNEQGLQGGVLYYDGQFDDARLALNLAQTAIEHGAVVLNYTEVIRFLKKESQLHGVVMKDIETETEHIVFAKAIFNATGVFTDAVLQLDQPKSKPVLTQSQGVHLVFKRSHFNSATALMVPKTSDGRVLFVIPWHNQVVAGTTDTPVPRSEEEPRALAAEIDFILETLQPFLKKRLTRTDIQSVFAGLRPLVLPQSDLKSTKELARDHKLLVSNSGLISVLGGKWTTYRKMAEDALDTAVKTGKLEARTCITKTLAIHGFAASNAVGYRAIYGSDAKDISVLEKANEATEKKLHPHFPFTEADVIWAVQNELAVTVEDVLARRLRLLFLDAHAAQEAAPRVAGIMATLLHKNEAWQATQIEAFTQLADGYKLSQTYMANIAHT